MARKNGDLISGVLGPLVFRVMNGVQYVKPRCAPGKMKQTLETKRAANTFGMGSALGSKIRGTLKVQLQGVSNQGIKNRLSGRLAQILGSCRAPKSKRYNFDRDSFAGLDDFEFDARSTVAKLLGRPPVVVLAANKIKVQLPQLFIPSQVKFPYKGFQCKVNVSVSLLRLRDGLYKADANTQTMVCNKNMKKTDAHEFEFSVPNGCLCIVSLFLVYETAEGQGFKPINSKSFNPGCICKTFITEGDYYTGDEIFWKEMKKFP
ncbi:hypothetical protein SAMN06265348_108285 [Pedobacter westerhofensis]|uniref:Uncharacterized protein n=1 Tax=Pedobacter westerhofensis TaxID=425512 RepID=A0A521EME0_9SPHI|nr:hypothetical protein [Pedobacter westerhofensis]SMO85078.1 hypothetical protein SAMN06265348_108285 [Pedobacter westerhofensis]